MRDIWKTEKATLNFPSILPNIWILGNCFEMFVQAEQVFDCLRRPKMVFTIFEYILNVIIRFLR